MNQRQMLRAVHTGKSRVFTSFFRSMSLLFLLSPSLFGFPLKRQITLERIFSLLSFRRKNGAFFVFASPFSGYFFKLSKAKWKRNDEKKNNENGTSHQQIAGRKKKHEKAKKVKTQRRHNKNNTKSHPMLWISAHYGTARLKRRTMPAGD